MKKSFRISPAVALGAAAALLLAAGAGVFLVYRMYQRPFGAQRSQRVMDWILRPGLHPDWAVQPKTRCGAAPLLMPTSGFIGYLWDDSFRIGHRHQGIDIFGGGQPGETPIYAAYGGYLTRLPGWKSSLIVRVPQDPLDPGRQIWMYYTHMASPDGQTSYISERFPPGTSELPVQAGDLLGKQGNFSGTPDSPVGVHLHFSIVLSKADGSFRNETYIANTLDPSRYLGLGLNALQNHGEIPLCGGEMNNE
jgi:peptidoglycan LD-endopeptidase LytH